MSQPQTVTINDETEARRIAASDFSIFLTYVASLRQQVPPDFHLRMCAFLQGNEPRWRSKKKVILGFRVAAKSWMVRQWVQWRWLRCPLMQVIIQSSNEKKAKDQVGAILTELRSNPLMAHIAPKGVVGEIAFNLQGIKPEQGDSIICAGLNTSLVGSRADIFWPDDPEPDDDPESQRDRVISIISEADSILHSPKRHLCSCKGTIPNCPKLHADFLPVPEQTQLVVTGQPHFEGTAYLPREDEEHPLNDAKFMMVPVLRPDGSWTWPEIIEAKYYDYENNRPKTLEEVKRSIGSTAKWELEYMLNPNFAAEAGSVIKTQYITTALRVVPHPICVIDPADGSCETAWTIGGRVNSDAHVLNMGGIRGDSYEGDIEDESVGESIWQHIFSYCDLYNVREIVIEKNFIAPVRACRRFIRKSRRSIVVNETIAKANKLRRITTGLEQPINSGITTFAPEVLRDRENMRQLRELRWDKLPTPCDRIDSLEQFVSWFIENPALTRPNSERVQYAGGQPIGMFATSGANRRFSVR